MLACFLLFQRTQLSPNITISQVSQYPKCQNVQTITNFIGLPASPWFKGPSCRQISGRLRQFQRVPPRSCWGSLPSGFKRERRGRAHLFTRYMRLILGGLELAAIMCLVFDKIAGWLDASLSFTLTNLHCQPTLGHFHLTISSFSSSGWKECLKLGFRKPFDFNLRPG